MKTRAVVCGTCGVSRKVADNNWLRLLRMKNGKSLRSVALEIGISAPYLSDIELGRRPCTETVRKFYQKHFS